MINVEVVYALPDSQKIISLEVEEGCTVFEAVKRSAIIDAYPEIELDSIPMGIFSKVIKDPKNTPIQEGQRVELYRPLIADPKEARARRAEQAKAAKAPK